MCHHSHLHNLEIISNIKWEDGYVCRRCGCKNYKPGVNYYYGRKCIECHYEESAIKFTSFANSRDVTIQINILRNLDILHDVFNDNISKSKPKSDIEEVLPSLLRKSIYSSAEDIGDATNIDDKTVKRFLRKLENKVLISLLEHCSIIDIKSKNGIEVMLRIIIHGSQSDAF
jgi:hypothetical protein